MEREVDKILNPDLIVRYLLGEALSEGQQAEIERRLFVDDEFLEEIQAIEFQLMARYLRHDLTAREHELFESHFLLAQERRNALEFVRGLSNALDSGERMNEAESEILETSVSSIHSPSKLIRSRYFPWIANLANLSARQMRVAVLGVAAVLFVGVVLWSFRAERTALRERTALPDKKNVAILPFRVQSSQSVSQILANGLTESVTEKLTQLTLLPSLQIAAASEVRSRQIQTAENARNAFGANLMVVGSIEELNGTIRITCNLVDASNERRLATKVISESASDILSMQDQLITAIVEMLGLQVKPAERAALNAHDTSVSAARESFLQARGYFQNYDRPENVDRAIVLLEQALKLDSNYAAAAAAEGEAYLRKFEFTKEPQWIDEATKDCQRSLRLDASLPAAHSCMGNVYRTTGRYQVAAKEFQRAVEIEPTNDDLYRELARTRQFFSKSEAEETFKRAIALRPHNWVNYDRLGVYYYDLTRYDDAARMFQQVIALAPDCLYGYSNLGGAYIKMGRYAEAIPVLEKSTAMQATAAGYSNLAVVYYVQRRFLESAQTFEQALILNPKNYIIWGNLAEAYYWAPGKRSQAATAYDRAIPLAEEQLRLKPLDGGVLAQLATYHAMKGDKEVALTNIQSALLLEPMDAEVLYKAAIVYNQFEDINKTLEYLGKAVAAGYSKTIILGAANFDSLWGNPRFQQLVRQKSPSV